MVLKKRRKKKSNSSSYYFSFTGSVVYDGGVWEVVPG